MQEIIEIADLRKRFKLELDIMAEFFATNNLKMAVLSPENQLKIFSQQNDNFEIAVKKINLKEDLYQKIVNAVGIEIKAILEEYFDDFKGELLCFKVKAAEYIYIIYFPFKKNEQSHNPKSIRLFQKQLKAVLDDIYRQEEIKSNLSRKNSENKILKKEKYITSSALDSVPGNICILDKKGNIVYTNSSWDKFAVENGVLAQNVGVGENYLKVCRDSVLDGDLISAKAYNGILSVLANKQENFSLDYPCHSETEKRWFRMHVSYFKGIGSYELMISHQNITQEITAEKKFEEILNKLPVAIIKFDSEMKLIYFNIKSMNLFDLSQDDLGRKFCDLKVADQSNDDFLDKLYYAAENKKRIEFRTLIEKNGTKMYCRNYLIPEFEMNDLKTITSIIPEEVTAEMEDSNINNKIKKQRNHYFQFFNNFPYALVLLNIDEKIINANKKFSQLFKYEMEELKNQKLDDLIVPNSKKEEARELSHLVLTGDQLEDEVCRINSRGEKLNLKLIAFPVLLNNNKIGIHAIYREIK